MGIGARILQDVIERREEIAQSIKEIIFDQGLQDSLSMAAQSKRTGEAKVITARAEVESAKLMRQAADILSSAPAMQIRYLEAMQSMAKSSNSKVIFMPGPGNVGSSMAMASAMGEGPEHNGGPSAAQKFDNTNDFGGQDSGFQRAINAHVVENI